VDAADLATGSRRMWSAMQCGCISGSPSASGTSRNSWPARDRGQPRGGALLGHQGRTVDRSQPATPAMRARRT